MLLEVLTLLSIKFKIILVIIVDDLGRMFLVKCVWGSGGDHAPGCTSLLLLAIICQET